MKKIIFFITFLIIIPLLTGCALDVDSKGEKEKGLEKTVVDVDCVNNQTEYLNKICNNENITDMSVNELRLCGYYTYDKDSYFNERCDEDTGWLYEIYENDVEFLSLSMVGFEKLENNDNIYVNEINKRCFKKIGEMTLSDLEQCAEYNDINLFECNCDCAY